MGLNQLRDAINESVVKGANLSVLVEKEFLLTKELSFTNHEERDKFAKFILTSEQEVKKAL